MVKSLDEVIERLQYKADNIKAKLEPSYFTECIDYLKTLNSNEHYSETDELDGYGYGCSNKTCVERVRNKAIDEFIKRFDDICDTEHDRCNDFGNCNYCYMAGMREIAEQMKGE
jgi:hypothetical protein